MRFQAITPEQVLRMPGTAGVVYELDRPPFTRYRWTGEKFISDVGQDPATKALVGGDGQPISVGGGSYNLLTALVKGILDGPSSGSTFQLAATGASGQTFQVQTVLECEADAIQVGVFNADTVAVAGVHVSSLASAQLQADNSSAANNNGVTWLDHTAAGSATGTLAANSSGATGQPPITWFDVMPQPTVSRTDSGKTLPVLSVRVDWPTGVNYTYLPGPGAGGAAWESDNAAVGNRPYRVRLQAVSAATNATRANLTSTTTQTAFWPAILIRYWPRSGGCRQLVLVGDSELSNIGGTVPRYGFAQIYQAALSTPAKPIEIVNMSLGGSVDSQILTAARCIAPILPGATVIFANGTPNGTTTTLSAADVARWRGTKAQLKALFAAYKQVVMTMMPINPALKPWGATDSFRQAMNATEVAQTEVKVLDAASAVSGGLDGNGQELMALTSDDLHPNDAGKAAIAAKLQSLLPV